MATRRSPSRPGSGPGRGGRSPASGTHRRRTTGRSATTSTPVASDRVAGRAASDRVRSDRDRIVADTADQRAEPGREDLPTVAETRARDAVRRRSSLTTRAIALAVVLLVLVISYASSLRIYLSQRHEIAASKVEIAQRQSQIADLQSQLSRWNDPDYVKTQARARLGWVVPGEIGFHVIGPDGRPVGANTAPSGAAVAKPEPKAWWDTLWGSVRAADAPPAAKPTQPPAISVSSKPKR